MRLLVKNVLVGLALLMPPLLAESFAAFRAQEPGAGVQVLLYWPAPLGLIAFALAAFVCLNVHGLRQRPAGVLLGAIAAFPATAIWFSAAFLVVFQLHFWRGGQM